MEFERVIAELFADEDRARAMAVHLMELAKRDAHAAAAERDSLLEFLRGPMERHMAYEERELFPRFAARGLAPEIQVAQKHHESIRKAAEALARLGSDADVAKEVFLAARLMLHHTNFEGDYLYPELNREEWRALMRQTVIPPAP